MSGGPYIGPRGGKWADPEHTIPWKEPEPARPRVLRFDGPMGVDDVKGLEADLSGRMGDKPPVGKKVEQWVTFAGTGSFGVTITAAERPGRAHATRSADGKGGYVNIEVLAGKRLNRHQLRMLLAHELAHAADTDLNGKTVDTVSLHDGEHATHWAEKPALRAEGIQALHEDGLVEMARDRMAHGPSWGGPKYTREQAVNEMLDSIPSKRALGQAGLLDEMRAYADKLIGGGGAAEPAAAQLHADRLAAVERSQAHRQANDPGRVTTPPGMAKGMNIGDLMGPALDGSGYKGVLNFHGMLLGIEHATGDVNPWSKRKTKASYGEFPGTLGNDGDPVDFLLGHDWDSDRAFVIQQRTPNGQNEWEHSDANGGPPQYDEDKVVLGARTEAEACDLFEDYYHGSGREVGGVLVLTLDELCERLGAEERRGFSIFKGLDGTDPVTGGPIVAQFYDDLLTKALTGTDGDGRPYKLPDRHKPAMVVPRGGSCCANCKWASIKADGPHCGEPNFQRWNGGRSRLPVDDPETFCSDWYEAKSDTLAKSQTPPAGFAPIPGGSHGGYRKRKASGRGWDYWYPDQHREDEHPDWEPTPGVTGVAGMKPGQFAFVMGHGTKLFRWTPEHEGDIPAGQTWMQDMETGEHAAVLTNRVQPARGKAKAAAPRFGGGKKKPPTRPVPPVRKKQKPAGDNLPPPPPLPQGPTSDVPAAGAPRVPVFEGSTAKPGTVLHGIEHGQYGVLRYRDASGRTQVGMYVPKEDQKQFLAEMRGLTHAAVSHVARTHRIREKGGGGGLSPEYQDLYSAAQLGLVQAIRSYKGKVDFRAHAYRYMKTYSAMEARDSLGRGVPVPSRIRRLTEGYLAAVNRAQVMFGAESPTDEQVARAWNVTKKHVYQRDLGRYVRTGAKGPEAVDQASEQLPMEDWQVRTPSGEATGKLFPGKLALVDELRKFTAGDRTEGSEWMEDMQVASVLPRHAAATMPVGTALHLRQEVDGILADMEPAHAQALTLRWGLDGGEPMELAELAEALKLTGEGASKKAGISAAEKLVNRAKTSFATLAHSRKAEVARYAESWSRGGAGERVKVDPPAPGAKSYTDLATAFKGDNDSPAVADERVRIYTTLAAEGGGSEAEAALRKEASGEATAAEVDALRERYFVARDKQRLRAFHLQTRTVPVDPNVARGPAAGTDPNNVGLYSDEVLHGYMRAVARRGLPGFAEPSSVKDSPGATGPSRVWSDERLARFLGVPVDRIKERAGGVAPPTEG